MTDDNIAYWFAAADKLPHGDGRKVVIGKTHRLRGEIVLCAHALHCSAHPCDALKEAPGPLLFKVRYGGTIIRDDDKIGCSARTYLARLDATDLLLAFARQQALSVAHLWEMPPIMRTYLETGDRTLREAADMAARVRPHTELPRDAVLARWAAVSASSNIGRPIWTARCASAFGERPGSRDTFLAMVEAAFAAQQDAADAS